MSLIDLLGKFPHLHNKKRWANSKIDYNEERETEREKDYNWTNTDIKQKDKRRKEVCLCYRKRFMSEGWFNPF